MSEETGKRTTEISAQNLSAQNLPTQNLPTQNLPAQNLHKYVGILVAVFGMMAIAFPTALIRVSQTEKFAGSPVKSWSISGEQQQARK